MGKSPRSTTTNFLSTNFFILLVFLNFQYLLEILLFPFLELIQQI